MGKIIRRFLYKESIPIYKKVIVLILPIIIIGFLFYLNSGHEPHEIPYIIRDAFIYSLIIGFSTFIFGSLFEKININEILGEITAGIVISSMTLFGIYFFEGIGSNIIIEFLAILGIIVSIFKVGLETNLADMKKVGWKAFWSAIIGVVTPMVLTMKTLPLFIPNQTTIFYAFVGATLTATSIAMISVSLGDSENPLIKTAKNLSYGAGGFDDVFGILLLSTLTPIALTIKESAGITTSTIPFDDMFLLITKAVLFFFGSILIGQIYGPYIIRFSAKLKNSKKTLTIILLGIGVFFSGIAYYVGLEMIIGAFTIGLSLNKETFLCFNECEITKDITEKPSTKHTKYILEKYSYKKSVKIMQDIENIIARFFFFMIGYNFDISVMNFNSIENFITIFAVLLVIAVISKLPAGIPAPKGTRLLVGLAMMARGEVGFIFAERGSEVGVFNPEMYSNLVLVVMATTFIAPITLRRRVNTLCR